MILLLKSTAKGKEGWARYVEQVRYEAEDEAKRLRMKLRG
jgi:hypothetical protein